MRIIKVDNYDREGPGHDDVLVAVATSPYWAEKIVMALRNFYDNDPACWFKSVPDEYKLKEFIP